MLITWLLASLEMMKTLFASILISSSLSMMVQAPVSPSPVVVQIQEQSKDLLDYVMAVIQLLTLISLVVYVIKTWQIASATRNAAEATRRSTQLSERVIEEMKAARTQEIAPQVIIYIDNPDNNWTLYLVAKNTGKSVAKDIQFNFDPPLMCGFGNRSHESEISFVKNGIRSLAPGQEIKTCLSRCNCKPLR